mgnify:FL=1
MNHLNTFYLSANPSGGGMVSIGKPTRESTLYGEEYWYDDNILFYISKNAVKAIVGHTLTWKDEPVKVELRLK